MNPAAGRLVTPTGDAAGVHQRRVDRGSVSVELSILSVPIIALIILAIVTGRTETAYNAITIAAHDAARAASISRSQHDAADRAGTVAHTTLAEQGLTCQQIDVTADVSQFSRTVGQPAAVTVTVTCHLSFDDLGLGFTRQLAATFTSPIDVWRHRS